MEKNNKDHTAMVYGVSLPISTKASVELCNFIRYKKVSKIKKELTQVLSLKLPVPFNRYNWDLCHKKGIYSSARYPVKTSKFLLSLLNSLEKNAELKGLDINKLVIIKAIANKSEKRAHHGRSLGTRMKNTHIELIAEEKE